MNEDQFEPRQKRYQMAKECPCGKSNKDGKFSPFKGQEQGFAKYGKCHSCDQVFLPPNTHDQNQIGSTTQKYIDPDILTQSMSAYDKTNFYKYCVCIFPEQVVRQVFLSMFIGGAMDGATVFWLVDSKGRVCQPKNIFYGTDGKRDKSKPPMVPAQYKGGEGYFPCAFNAYNTSVQEEDVIAVVESEKTAALCTLAFPNLDITWISGGGATAMSGDKAHEIRERQVLILYDADEAGREGAAKLDHLLKKKKCQVLQVDPFEDLTNGYDLADFIADYHNSEEKMNWMRKFLQDKINSMSSSESLDYEAGVFSVRAQKDLLLRTFRHGKKKGETTHMEELDVNFKWKPTFLYTMTGYPNSGKSESLLFMSLMKAKYSGWNWILYVPESMSSDEGMLSVDEVVDTLAHTYVGKSTDPENPYQMSEEEYLDAIDFIDEHYLFIYPPEGMVTPAALLDYTEYVINTYDKKFNGLIVDPFNNLILETNAGSMLDDVITKTMNSIKAFIVKTNLVAVLVVHPKSPPIGKDGDVPPANAFTLRGGASINNKSDCIISTHRPDWFKESIMVEIGGKEVQVSGRNSTKVEFHVFKMKNQKLAGTVLGYSTWHFNRKSNRYENQYNLSPLDPAYRSQIDRAANHQKVILEKPDHNSQDSLPF